MTPTEQASILVEMREELRQWMYQFVAEKSGADAAQELRRLVSEREAA